MASQGRDVSPDRSPAQPVNESTALTRGAASYPAYPRAWFIVPRYIYHTIKATLYCSNANFLLVFIPLSIIAAARDWNPVAIFTLSFFAMFPLAELLSWSTEQLSASTGQVIGGLLMAAFGNAVEMIVGITALSQGEFRIVQSSMVGSILSGTLLILGSCLFVAGYKEKEVKFNVDLTSIMSSLMIVASASLVIPSASYFADLRSNNLESNLKPGTQSSYILTLSHIAAIILLVFYCLYLFFQLKTHADIFAESNQAEPEGSPELDPWAAGFVLVLSTIGVSVCSDYLIDSVDGSVEELGVSRAFIGLILVPIVGNAGEFVAAVNQARKNNIDFALGLIVGSTLQIALFVTPFLVILGWIIGKPMSLRFDTFQTTVLSMSVIVVNCLVRDGRTNYFEGFLLLGTYLIIAIAFYVHPDVVDTLAS
ncbi:Calcium/proton exchanger [Acephala macrosclerotiorum]|nr:Calcium/proton exchanger [Acephala macrosclerotiorum]